MKGFIDGFGTIIPLDIYSVFALFGVGLMLLVITYLACKWSFILFMKYLRWNIDVVKEVHAHEKNINHFVYSRAAHVHRIWLSNLFEAKKIANQPRTPLHYVKDYQKEDAAIKS